MRQIYLPQVKFCFNWIHFHEILFLLNFQYLFRNKYDIPINAFIHENVVQEDEPIDDDDDDESLNDVVKLKKLV